MYQEEDQWEKIEQASSFHVEPHEEPEERQTIPMISGEVCIENSISEARIMKEGSDPVKEVDGIAAEQTPNLHKVKSYVSKNYF